jgi:hypothetical protein
VSITVSHCPFEYSSSSVPNMAPALSGLHSFCF